MPDYVPSRDAEVLSFATNMSTKISATPVAFGLVAGDATALSGLVLSYSSALALATDPVTRTKGVLVAKDVSRDHLVAGIRSVVRKITATPTVTAQQRTDLGLPILDRDPSPIADPTTSPLVNILERGRSSQIIGLADITTPTSRAKPEGVQGAEVWVYVGETPPAELTEWQLKGLTTRTRFEIEYGPEDAGKPAHIVARWYNPRGQTGPTSGVVTERIAA